jgi:hypothetical protein
MSLPIMVMVYPILLIKQLYYRWSSTQVHNKKRRKKQELKFTYYKMRLCLPSFLLQTKKSIKEERERERGNWERYTCDAPNKITEKQTFHSCSMTQLNNNTIYTYLYNLKKKHKHKTASLSLCLFDAANKTQKNSTVRAHVRNLTSKDKQNKYAHICVRERERESFGCIYSFEVYCWITNTHTHTHTKKNGG